MSGDGATDAQRDRQLQVRRLGSGDAKRLRDIRLRALSDAPYAFASWLAREADCGPEFWQERVAESAAGQSGAIFAACDRGLSVGMAGGFFADDERTTAMLWGMWVDPNARRCGIGRGLLRAVMAWAADAGASRMTLWVTLTEASRPAAALYRELEFAETGAQERLESDPSLIAREMSRAL